MTTALRHNIEALYEVFSKYDTGTGFCTFCYSNEDIKVVTETPLRELDIEISRKLLWETGDHWENSEVYRHYLPRILQILAPPISEEDLYPAHLFETLRYHNVNLWPEPERKALGKYLRELTPYIGESGDTDKEEWNTEMVRVNYL